MKTILVPTDFSKSASNAAEYAVNLAKEIKATVLLFHVYHVPVFTSETDIMLMTPNDFQKEKEEYLKKEATNLSEKNGVESRNESHRT